MQSIQRGDDQVTGSLTDFVHIWLPNDWAPGSNKPMVLLAMGGNDDTAAIWPQQQMRTFAKKITDAGYGIITSKYGSAIGFGNPAMRTQVNVVANHAQSDNDGFSHLLVGAGKLVLVGFSMGATTLLNWAGNTATPANKIKAFVGVNPLLDINVPSLASSVSAAYPSGVTNSTDDPKTMAQAGKYAGINCRVCWASDDSVLAHSTMAPFVTATGATEVTLGAVGHQWTNVALPAVTDAIIAACAA